MDIAAAALRNKNAIEELRVLQQMRDRGVRPSM